MKKKVAQLIAPKQFEVIEEEIQPYSKSQSILRYIIVFCLNKNN